MTDDDFIYILCEFCKNYARKNGNISNDKFVIFTEELISKMVLVNKLCREHAQNNMSWALQNGGPFEFNLRDLFRWVQAIDEVCHSVILLQYFHLFFI